MSRRDVSCSKAHGAFSGFVQDDSSCEVRMVQMTNGWVKIEQPTGKPYYHHKADKVRNVLVYGNIEFDNIMCMTSDRYFGFKLLV